MSESSQPDGASGWLPRAIIRWASQRTPHRVIGERYLHRWHVLPRNRLCNVYLHKFLGDDDDRALHDHPWISLSWCLAGRMVEYTASQTNAIDQGQFKYRKGRYAHRLEIVEGPVWTLFITGPKFREWGFHCPQGWRHWREFTDESGDRIGRGCEDL